MEAEASSSSTGASKIGRTSKTTMKNPRKEKEPGEEFEYKSDDDRYYIDFRRTYDE